MDFLLLGCELPAFEFRLEPGKPPRLRCDSYALVRLRKGWHGGLETLRWIDVLLDDFEGKAIESAYAPTIQRLAEVIGKEHSAQWAFFQRYVAWIETQPAITGTDKRKFKHVLEEPALLPCVWMYRMPGALPCMPAAPAVPFRVDFVLIYENRRLVIEINSPAEFMEYSIDLQWRGVGAHLCDAKFTQLLRQDRWLRRENWEVFRFSHEEVETEPIEMFMVELGVWSRGKGLGT